MHACMHAARLSIHKGFLAEAEGHLHVHACISVSVSVHRWAENMVLNASFMASLNDNQQPWPACASVT